MRVRKAEWLKLKSPEMLTCCPVGLHYIQIRLIQTGCSHAGSVNRVSSWVSCTVIRHSELVVGPRYQTGHDCWVRQTRDYGCSAARCACTDYRIILRSAPPPISLRPRDTSWRRRQWRHPTWTAWLDCLQTTTTAYELRLVHSAQSSV